MQFLLVGINSKYIHTNPAIYSLKAYAGEELYPYIGTVEYTINNRADEILSDIFRRKPDVIGFSCYIWNFTLIQELLSEIPKLLPGVDIWLGGPEVSFDTSRLLQKYSGVKGIMVGEGEATFRQLLVTYLESAGENMDAELLRIPGLILPQGFTGERELLRMDELPFLYPGDEKGMLQSGDTEKAATKIIYYESARGCPFRCSYCLSAIDKTVRLRSMDMVKKELQTFLENKLPQVKFIDRTFNCNHAHAMEIWTYLKEHDNGITNFHFEIAADLLTEEEISLLQTLRPGLIQLEIGVQTTNPETLRLIHRPAEISHIEAVVKALHKNHNMHLHLDLIAGLPGEDFDSFRESFNRVYHMKPEQLQLGFLKVLKGAPIREQAKEYGIVYQERPPYEVLYTRWISYEELLKLKRVEEMLELYYNSGQFAKTLSVLENYFESPFDLYDKLSAYYEEKGYFVYAPARSSRYTILLEFAVACVPEGCTLFSELLTYDYYSRENAKSRPSFAPELSVYYDKIREFYQKEEENPKYLKAYSRYHARQTMKMTHMEVFTYPVWEEPEMIQCESTEPTAILFDYQRRDCLTGNAYATYFIGESHIL